jgi:hypothetical protein
MPRFRSNAGDPRLARRWRLDGGQHDDLSLNNKAVGVCLAPSEVREFLIATGIKAEEDVSPLF